MRHLLIVLQRNKVSLIDAKKEEKKVKLSDEIQSSRRHLSRLLFISIRRHLRIFPRTPRDYSRRPPAIFLERNPSRLT